MVDPVGAKPASPLDRRIAPVASAARAAGVAPVADRDEAAQHAGSVAEAARRAAAVPPVDHERVAVLRAAIANGDYRPAPEAVADRLIGHMQEWIAK